MRIVADWSANWPPLVLPPNIREWSKCRLLLGLQVAAVVAAVFTAVAAEIGGYKIIGFLGLGITSAAIMTRVERLNSVRDLRQERHH